MPLRMFINDDRDRGLKDPQMEGTKPCDTCRPDADNSIKFVMDALQGALHADDAQMVKLMVTKIAHMNTPCTGYTQSRFRIATHNYLV